METTEEKFENRFSLHLLILHSSLQAHAFTISVTCQLDIKTKGVKWLNLC